MRGWALLALVLFAGFGTALCTGERSAHAAGPDTPNSLSASPTPSSEAPITSEDIYYKTQGIISGPPAPSPGLGDYPKLGLPFPFNDSRLIIWFLAQQHLYFGGLILGVLLLVMLIELRGLMSRTKEAARRYDELAFEMLGLIILAFSIAALLGGFLLIGLLTLYPHLTAYLTATFRPYFLMYGLLFMALSISVYFYYYSWKRMQDVLSKWIHACIGVLANIVGTTMMMLANSWGTFMLTPSGIDNKGRFLGDYSHVLRNPLWNSFNVHRFLSHILLGTACMAAYAAYHALNAEDPEERARYDWVGHVTFLIMLSVFFTFPFVGYSMILEIDRYNQQLWMTLTGGLLAWWIHVLSCLIGLLFLGINYYIWQRIDSVDSARRYRSFPKYVYLILFACTFVYVTPHTLVMKPKELLNIGGQQHPVVGNFGVESAKQAAVYIMMVVTTGSLILLRRSHYRLDRAANTFPDAALMALFFAGMANIIWLAIYGFHFPTNVLIGLKIPMVATAISTILFGFGLTFATTFRSNRVDSQNWGQMPARGQFALLFISIIITWIIGHMGYMKSALRLFWHVLGIVRDNSPWTYNPTMGFAANMITLNALVFWGGLLLLFWFQKQLRSR